MSGTDPASQSRIEAGVIGFAQLTLGNQTRLLFARREVNSIEHADEVVLRAPRPGAVGWLGRGTARAPIYCLSERLDPVTNPPVDARLCVLLRADGGLFGILCSGFRFVAEPALCKVPPALAPFMGPSVYAVTINEDGASCASSAAMLYRALTGA